MKVRSWFFVFTAGSAALLLSVICALTAPPAEAADASVEPVPGAGPATAGESLDTAADEGADLGRELYGAGPDEVLKRIQGAARTGVLGISIATDDKRPEGVEVTGVTAGGPAEKAGLQQGDLIKGVNDRPLVTRDGVTPAKQLVRFMRGVEPGEIIAVDYLRGEERRVVQVTAASGESAIARLLRENLGALQGAIKHGDWESVLSPGGSRRSMELIALTPELGRYFGADEGLLVLRAPSDGALGLREGDVILAIGGRRPEDPDHALRILSSYRPGESFDLLILRDREKKTLQVKMSKEAGAGEPSN